MSPEKSKELNDRFGHILRSDKSPQHALHMYGFECADGWFQLLWDLLENIEKHLVTCTPEEVNDFHVQQIKEKFGTLRFYCNNSLDGPIRDMICNAEVESATTCERCGDKGEVRNFGRLLQCLCWKHFTDDIIDDIEGACVNAVIGERDRISPWSGKVMGKEKYFTDPTVKEYLRKRLTWIFGPEEEKKDVQNRR